MSFLNFKDLNDKISVIQSDPRQIQSRTYLTTLTGAITTAAAAVKQAVSAYNAVMQTTISGGALVDVTPDTLKSTVNSTIETAVDSLRSAKLRLENILKATESIQVPIAIQPASDLDLIALSGGFQCVVAGCFIKDLRFFLLPKAFIGTATALFFRYGWSGNGYRGVIANVTRSVSIIGNDHKFGSIIVFAPNRALYFQIRTSDPSDQPADFDVYILDFDSNKAYLYFSFTLVFEQGQPSITNLARPDSSAIEVGDDPIELSPATPTTFTIASIVSGSTSINMAIVKSSPSYLETGNIVNVAGDATLSSALEALNASPLRVDDMILALKSAEFNE